MSVSTEILVCTSVRLTAWLEGVRAPLNSSCLVMDSRPLEAGATRTLKLSTQDHWVCQSLRETVTLCPLTPEIYLYQPPRLCKSLPQTMRVKEWQMLFFECKVEGFPKPTVTWLCNGEELTNKGHVKIIAVKNYHSCEIARAYAERDTGKFTVRLSHPSGSVIESSCEVEIQQDITLLSDLKEKKKSDLVLEREAKAEQLAAKYAKKAEEVTKSSKTETTESVTTVESEKVSAVEKTAEGTAAKVVEEAVAEAAAVVSKETVKEPAPSAETASAPVEAAPEPAPEPAPAAEPVPEPAPKSEAAPAPAAEPAPKPAPEPAPEPEAAPAPAAEPAPEPAPEPEAAPAPAAEPAPEPVPEPVPEPAPEPAAPEPAPVSEPVAEEATKADAAPEVAKEDEVDAAPQPEPCESSVPEEKEPAYVSPDFVTKLEKEYRCLDTDTNIKIQCQVEGKPLPEVSWVKDNKKLSPSENLTVEWNADSGISTLWFQSLTVQDSGKYTCIASSSAGSCSCSATFTVDTAAANLSLAGVKPERAPTVKKGLDKEYSFVTTDTKAKLQCEVDGHPTPDVLWKKDGKTLVNGSKHGIEWDAASGKATLKFKSLTEADSGCYECSASSTAGSVSSSANITVKKPEKKPTVVDALKKEYSFVETKETVRLQCKMEGNPCPEISWTKDGKALGASEQMTFEWNAKTGVAALVFKGVSVSNTGKYECVAKSSVGTTKSATTMTVKEPERAPSVVEPLNKEYNALESDENVCLKCKLDGNPVPKISWTKDGKKLSASDNVKMEWDAATCTASLVFKHPKSSDSGNYECVAKSSAGTTKSPTTLTIKKPDVIPTIQRPLEKTYTTVEGGESLRLKCQVDGYPSPHVTWKKDEKEVVLGDNVAMEWNPETGSAALVFKQPMCEDSGDYQCVATSPVGTTNSHTTLTVKKPEKVPSVVEQLDKVYDCQEGGDSVRLTCQVEGNPSPTVTWLKDGKEVTADGNIIMEWDPETGSAALVFKRPTCEDSGDYQCVAKSPLGTTNSHTTLTVKKVPTVVKPLNKAYEPVERDQNVRLVCKLDGTPAPEITWLKDGKKIVPGENVAMEWDPETGSAALVFKQPTCEDSGDYQCVAKSPLGTTNSHTTLSVKKVPTVVKPLDKAYEPVEGDQNVRLVCKLDGTPAPEITWLKDGKKVVPGENVAMEWDPETGSAALVFKQPMCEDSGDYQCVAKSPLGTTNSHTTLTVKKVPTVVKPLNKAYEPVEGDQNVRLVCKLDGIPAPEITWLKDGKKIVPGENVAMEWDPETGSAALVFKQPKCEDSGDYQCVAKSPLGTTNSHTTLTVKKVPMVVKPLDKAYEPVEGDQNVRLVCKLDGTPAPEITWLKDGKKIVPGENVTMEWDPETGSATLVFKQPMCEDSGDYQCVAKSPLGTTNSHTTLSVKKVPTVVKPLDKAYEPVEGDQNVRLVCKLDGTPAPEITWLKDGKKIVPGENVAMEWDPETGSAALVFKQPMCEDSGDYQCVATSPVGTTNSHTTLTVKKLPTIIEALEKSYDTVEGTESVRIVCKIDGRPRPEICWLKNGKEITPGDKLSVEWDTETGSAALVFKQPTCEDSGDYQCVATSSVGTTNTQTTLNVNKPPTMTKPLEKSYTCKAGDKNLRLACTVTGKPSPEVSWSKGGKKIKSSDDITIEWNATTGSAALVLKQPTYQDTGEYQCVATSPLGSTSTSTTIKVKKPEKKPAVVQPLDKEYNLTETKETITLTFKVDGNPVPEVSWLKDGKPLEAGGNISFGWNAETGSASLIFNGVSVGDSGKYECVATSTIGKTTSSTTIAVKKPEKKPTFSTPLQKENNKKEGDENFVMTCTVEGNPPPQVSWMKNGAKLEADDNISAQYDAEKGTASLTFKVLSCADAGNYECVAVSSAGTGKSKASLTVKSKKCFSPTTNQAFITSHQVPEIKPKFSKELDETYKVLVGDKNVTLACVVDGNPCPDVSWYKDGKKEKLVDTTNMKMKFDQSTGNASLIFSSVSLSDAGSYVCLADSAIGNKRSETSLKVTKPVCPPVFTDMATSQTVPVGGVAVFKCIVTSKSPATFTWKKGDKVLSSTDRIKISVSKTDTSLTITGVQFDDRATYTCSAKNEDGEEHTSGDLNVEEKGVKGRRTPLSDGPSSFIAGDEDDVFLPDDRKPKASYTWDTYVQDITILAEGHALYIADNINSDEESVVQHEHSNTNNVETANEEEYIVTLKISPDHYDSEMSHAVTNTEYGAESLEDGTTESNNSVDPTLSVQEENLPLSNHKRTQSEEMENDFESNTNLNGVVNKMELKELIQDCKTLKTEEGEEKDCTSSGHPESPVKPINFSFLINASPEDDSGEDSYSYEYSSESGEDFTQTLTGTRDRGYIDNIGSFERATLKDVEQVLPDNRDTRPGNRNIGLDDRDVGPDNRDTRPDNRDIELDDRIPIRNSEMLEEILEETVGGDLEEEAGQDVVDGAVESKVAVATESKSETVKVAETKSETTATQEVSVTKEEVKVVKAKSESVSKQEVSVKKEEAKVTQVTSESVSAAESTVQVLQELESSVSKLNETLSQTQETSVASSTSDSRIEIVEVTARHITNETSDEASEVRHRHHDHHGPEIIVPANSTKIPEHSEVELMVKVRAAKQANVRWMHEGEVVQQSERGYAMFVMLYILAYYIMLTRT
ncbi:muscle M-line assembly protein unc-89-like isoform X6 [Pecten maximus]|uniref:muscle M-line assembly protein unc-89-like isoform X6 n=1 Tax=Pecten maximus TaxID=6579 RepID=UPI001458CB98|nr:muscle M-line assembly protein unc-89-like isoform X6 [Pecten maximus]